MTCHCPKCANAKPAAVWPTLNSEKLRLLDQLHTAFSNLDYHDSHVTWAGLFQTAGLPAEKEVGNDLLQEFFQQYPHFYERISDRIPPARVLIELAKVRLKCDVDAQHFNAIQNAIIAYVSEVRQRLCYNQLDSLCSGFRGVVFDGEQYALILRTIARNYPKIDKSISQSTVSIAGEANRHLHLLFLESVGLRLGQDFEDLGSSERGDIRVFGPQRRTSLTVEVKSVKARERLSKSLSAMEGDKAAAGFFDSPQEFTAGKTRVYVKHGTLAIYLPPSTLRQLASPVASVLNYKQRPLYRSNEQFAQDCLHYSRHGEIP